MHYPVFQQILDRGKLDCFLETAQTFPFANISHAGNFRHGYIISLIFMDKCEHFSNTETVLIERNIPRICPWSKFAI